MIAPLSLLTHKLVCIHQRHGSDRLTCGSDAEPMTNSIPLNGSIRASVMRNPRRDAELEGGIQGIRDQFRVVLCMRVIEIVDCAEAMVCACEIMPNFIGNRASFAIAALHAKRSDCRSLTHGRTFKHSAAFGANLIGETLEHVAVRMLAKRQQVPQCFFQFRNTSLRRSLVVIACHFGSTLRCRGSGGLGGWKTARARQIPRSISLLEIVVISPWRHSGRALQELRCVMTRLAQSRALGGIAAKLGSQLHHSG